MALELLVTIKISRLEHGLPLSEPLHPDILMLKEAQSPWQVLK